MELLLVGFTVYFITIGFISAFLYLRTQKAGTYKQVILGGRSVHYVLTALSAHASDMSDWLFMAFPALLYTGGMVNAWIAIGLITGMLITWQYIAPQLRITTEKLNAMTLSTYFERRYDDTSGSIRLLSALISMLFFSIYIAAGLKGFGFLAESVFQIPYVYGLLVAIVCAVAYIFFGGYRTLAWIDCFQALFLLGVIFIVPYKGLLKIGGFGAIITQAANNNISLSLIPNTIIDTLNAILLAISWGVGYFGIPHVLTKFMGISNVKELSKAKYIGLAWQTSVLLASGMVGLIGIAYFSVPLVNKELVFVEMVKTLFTPLQIGFILSAIAGATLSVITAQILVLVSVITEDFYHGTIRKNATEKELLWMYHVSILCIVLLSFIVSLNRSNSIQELVQYAWMGFGCSFGPLMLLSLHSNYINKYGAITSILVGGSIASLWQLWMKPFFGASYGVDIPAVIPGFILSFACAYTLSYITKQ